MLKVKGYVFDIKNIDVIFCILGVYVWKVFV